MKRAVCRRYSPICCPLLIVQICCNETNTRRQALVITVSRHGRASGRRHRWSPLDGPAEDARLLEAPDLAAAAAAAAKGSRPSRLREFKHPKPRSFCLGCLLQSPLQTFAMSTTPGLHLAAPPRPCARWRPRRGEGATRQSSCHVDTPQGERKPLKSC